MHPLRPIARLAWLAILLWPEGAAAFCGFYVASSDAKLFNRSSQVALVRDGDRTVMTLASDYQGDPRQFALVVPVPTVLQRGQIHVGDSSLVAKLDAYSAPRLVEYHDGDPCPPPALAMRARGGNLRETAMMIEQITVGARGVVIEARYQVDEYDVLILSAKESGGLLEWLQQHGYRVPASAAPVVESYLKQGMKFFVAKVDLRRRAARGVQQLRPLQIAYESPKFVLPVRLGMANANGHQELFVYAITRQGRVEPVNYRSMRIPTGVEVPAFVKGEFGATWKAAFDQLVRRHGLGMVFTEYAWNMASCDPCPGPPLADEDLRALGVWWLGDGGPGAFLTRLHVRYDRASTPEDLVMQVTADRQSFQGRIVVRHEWTGEARCEAANRYFEGLPARREEQAKDLAALTGWPLHDVRERMGLAANWRRPDEARTPFRQAAWWESLWK